MGGEVVGLAGAPLHGVAGPAGGGGRVARAQALRAGVQGQVQPVAGRRLEDGEEGGVAVGEARPAAQQHLHHLGVGPGAVDLGAGRLRVLGGHHEGAQEAPVGAEPALDQPAVVGPGQGHRVVDVAPGGDHRDVRVGQHGVGDPLPVEPVPPRGLRVAPGRAPCGGGSRVRRGGRGRAGRRRAGCGALPVRCGSRLCHSRGRWAASSSAVRQVTCTSQSTRRPGAGRAGRPARRRLRASVWRREGHASSRRSRSANSSRALRR